MDTRTYRKLTLADEDKIVVLYQEGITYQEIARRFGVNPVAVWKTLKRRGIELNRQGQGSRARVTETCSVCGQEFTHYRSKPRKFCGQVCYQTSIRVRGHEWSYRRTKTAGSPTKVGHEP